MFDHHLKLKVDDCETVANLSAPAQDNILLILSTWKGWTRTLKINSVQKGHARNQGNLWKGQNRSISPDVEAFLAAVLDKVLVAANPSRLKGLKSKTYILRSFRMSSPQRRAAQAHQRQDGQRGGTRQHQPGKKELNNLGTWQGTSFEGAYNDQFALVLM